MQHILTVPLKHLDSFNNMNNQSLETKEEELLNSIQSVCSMSDDESTCLSYDDVTELGTVLIGALSNITDSAFRVANIKDVTLNGTTAIIILGGG